MMMMTMAMMIRSVVYLAEGNGVEGYDADHIALLLDGLVALLGWLEGYGRRQQQRR